MAIIGTFTPTKEGGWVGVIRTLMIDVKVRLVPNDNRDSDRAPAFRVFAGRSEVGAAWCERTSEENPRKYLSVRLDDPSLLESLSAAMFEDADGKKAQLVWSRRRLS
ncbi:DUF736 domain-containing protein [Shumkonia mesophila]|uniref:DUF736 domain-containing protein n=1 Tax=Shumkonia mesophila TaxID=2838854 RepID=UPI00293428EA|nr:DUF736 domain-containing protein [Shumkonia mesophila]